MESLVKLVSSLLEKEGKGVKVLFQLLTLLFFFSLLAFIPLLIAKKLQLFPSVIIDSGPSKSGVSNVVEQEKPLRLLDNIEIYSDVLTLDNLKFNAAEQEKLQSFKTKFQSSRTSAQIDVVKKGFSILDLFSSKLYPCQNVSFKRFNELFADSSISNHLSTQERKETFLSPGSSEEVTI